MAKKTASIRVHHVAKDLGVTSKAIVQKCTQEGIPDITNHMSALSAGLAATIREWFSGEEASGSAVETAAKVDLKKAKAKPRKKAANADTAVIAEAPPVQEAPPAPSAPAPSAPAPTTPKVPPRIYKQKFKL